MLLLVIYLLLALGVSFLCSILEAGLLSMSPSFVKNEEEKGKKLGTILRDLKADIDRPLAGILSLNTIAHTVGAAGVGAQAATLFGKAYFGIISAVLTLLILFFSEIIPKTLGAVYWKQLAGFTAYSCLVIIRLLYPLVWISEKLTKILQPKGGREGIISRDEVVAFAQLGLDEGVIAENESKIIRNLIRFRNIRIKDIMTPRPVLGSLSESITCGQAIKEESIIRFSRIPIYTQDVDHISGYVLKQKILEQVALDKHDVVLSEIKRPIRLVAEEGSLSRLFSDLFSNKEQMAIVVDDYGDLAGLVTNEDLIETLLGMEIMDESDHTEDMRELARERWKERAKNMGIEILKPRDKGQSEQE
jgi:CBS domain containing-hemolysin-like protein